MITQLALLALVQMSLPATSPKPTTVPSAAPDSDTRIRIRQDESHGRRTLIGRVIASDSASITLQLDSVAGAVTESVARLSIDQLEVSAGRHSNAGHGLLVGGVIGGALGLVAGIATQCSVNESYACSDGAGSVIGLTALGALFWGGIGALIGAGSSHEKWVRQEGTVAIAPLLEPVAGGARLGMSIRH